MKGINLLPEELKPKSYAIKLSKEIRKYAYGFLAILLIVVTVLGVTFFSLRFRYDSLRSSDAGLKSQIKTYEETEQKLVLVQDRLKKIDGVLQTKKAAQAATSLDLVAENLPQEVTIISAELRPAFAGITVSTSESKYLSRFFSTIAGLNFNNVSLLSLNYNDELGYRVEIGIVN